MASTTRQKPNHGISAGSGLPEGLAPQQNNTQTFPGCVVPTCHAAVQSSPGIALNGSLSAKTMGKLRAFNFAPIDPQQSKHGDRSTVKQYRESQQERADARDSLFSAQVEEQEPPTAGGQHGPDDFDDMDEELFVQLGLNHEVDQQPTQGKAIGAPGLDKDSFSTTPPTLTLPQSAPSPPRHQPQPFSTPQRPQNIPYVSPTVTSSKSATTSVQSMSPFVRKTPAPLARSHHDIPNLSPSRRLPTVFRIAEIHHLLAALPSASPPSAQAYDLTIELFARIRSSSRDRYSTKQHFILGDLFFPQRPPYLQGSFTGWHDSDLFDADTVGLITKPGAEQGRPAAEKICRAIVRIGKRRHRDGNHVRHPGSGPSRWSPTDSGPENVSGRAVEPLEGVVWSIWQASWEDVAYTRGVVGG